MEYWRTVLFQGAMASRRVALVHLLGNGGLTANARYGVVRWWSLWWPNVRLDGVGFDTITFTLTKYWRCNPT